MNMLILAAFGAGCLALMWGVQALALLATGDRQIFVPPLRHESSAPLVRWALKLALHLGLLGILFVFPLMIGEDPIDYHWAQLAPARWLQLFHTMELTVAGFAVLLLTYLANGWIRLVQRYNARVTVRKVARSCLIPLPLAFMEEAVFRGVVLRQLLVSLPADGAGHALAIVLSALLFSSVHFLRPQKRKLLPALGLFALGVILGMAYLIGGQTLWLPVAIHAGGVLVIQVTRPFVEYRGPAWLIGYPSYPICGVLGIAFMFVLIALVASGVGA